MKIVINTSQGWFGLSHEAMLAYAKRKGITLYPEPALFGRYRYYTVPPEKRTPEMPGRSREAQQAYNEAIEKETLYARGIPRDDPDLVAVVEQMGKAADDAYAELTVVEIPDDVEWQIEEDDGKEWVAEKHRTWG